VTVSTMTADKPSTAIPARIPASSGTDTVGRPTVTVTASTNAAVAAARPTPGAHGSARWPRISMPRPATSGTATSSTKARFIRDQSLRSAAMSVMSTSRARKMAVIAANPIAISIAMADTATSTSTCPSGRPGEM